MYVKLLFHFFFNFAYVAIINKNIRFSVKIQLEITFI